MLTIKKRHPWRKAMIYGGSPLLFVLTGVLTLLTLDHVNHGQFASINPQTEVVKKEDSVSNDTNKDTQETQTTSNDTGASQAAVPSRPSTSSKPIPTPASSQPASQETTPPTQTTPPVLEVPTPVTTPPVQTPTPDLTPTPDPTPSDPTIIDQITNMLTP